jgi:hypothetical protein
MKLLLFTGAGTSAELGVPAMQVMARQFIDHLHDIDLEPSIVDKVERLISDAGNDMEHAIDVIDKVEGGMLARRQLGETVDEAEIIPYRTLREEAEWFVQHCCEQIRVAPAIRMWSPALKAATAVALTIASTNYDRAVEIAAARLKITLDDGFDDFAGRRRRHGVDLARKRASGFSSCTDRLIGTMGPLMKRSSCAIRCRCMGRLN